MIAKLSDLSITLLLAALVCRAGARDAGSTSMTSNNNTAIEYNATGSYPYTISPINTVGSGSDNTNFSKFDLTLNTGFRMYTPLDATIEPGHTPNATTDFWITRPSAAVIEENCTKNVTYGVCATYIIISNATQLAQGQSDEGSCDTILSSDCIKAFEQYYGGIPRDSLSSSGEYVCGATHGSLPKECSLTDDMGIQTALSHQLVSTDITGDNCSDFQHFGKVSLSQSTPGDSPINGLNTSMNAINMDPRKFYDLSIDTLTVVILNTWQQDITNNRSEFSSSQSQTRMFCTRPKDIVAGSYVPPSFEDTFLNKTTNETHDGSDKNKTNSATTLIMTGSTGWELMLAVMSLSIFFSYL